MFGMIIPLLIGLGGYMILGLGKSLDNTMFKVVGTIMTTISGLWFLYNAAYSFGYLMA